MALVMESLTVCDWELVLAAYAYEVQDRPTMTDNSYDRLCACAAERSTSIPGFVTYTGQWIIPLADDIGHDILDLILEQARKDWPRQDDIHAPAIQAALDTAGIQYGCCCDGYKCWSEPCTIMVHEAASD